MSYKNVFILGVTGYIGGAVLVRLKHIYPTLHFTALVRSPKNDAAVRAAGVDHILHGDHSETDKIRDAAAAADVVVNCADADDLELTRAVLKGLQTRALQGGAKPILLHTSGTGVVSDTAEGDFRPDAEKVWNDANEEDIRSIPDDKPHRNIDNEIFAAAEKGGIDAYIIAPSTIYGTGNGPVNQISQQVPTVVRIALQQKKGVVVGPGTNLWNNVHIDDLVVLYDLVLGRAFSGQDKGSPYAKFYFGSVGEHAWGDVDRRVAKLLYERKKLQSPDAHNVPLKDLLKDAPFARYVASNSRSRSDRGFAIGWKPSAPSLEDTLPEDVDATLKQL